MPFGLRLLLLASLTTPTVPHASDAPCASVTFAPKTPKQGTLFRVSCNGATTAPEGRVRGRGVHEPLHFVRDGNTWVSLAPVPVDATDSLYIEIDARVAADAPM